MRFGSLFSGIGGLDLGLERAGMECTWQVEIDDYCTKVLTKNWPKVPKHKDIRDCGRHNLETVDLICGGFPCQPVSLAGKRQAQADPRWLWPEFARIIRELRPSYVLVENVPGLYSAGGSEVLADLAESGYDAEWDAIPAAAFGAPHLRYRIFIVAYSIGTAISQQPRRGRFSGPTGILKTRARKIESIRNGKDGNVADAPSTVLSRHWGEQGGEQSGFTNSGWWATEPDVGRVVDGVPARVERLRALGNAVVPQVAEWIGNCILEHAHYKKE